MIQPIYSLFDSGRSAIEIYGEQQLKEFIGLGQRYGQIHWSGYEHIKSIAVPPAFDQSSCRFSPNLVSESSELYDSIILNDVLEYSTDILEMLENATKLLKSGGRLLIAQADKRYSRSCLRAETNFATAFSVHKGKSNIGSQAFDAAYNTSLAFDTASFWHTGHLASRDALPFSEALSLWEKINEGHKFYLPYWPISEKGFLNFIREIIASNSLPFSLEAFVQVEEYTNKFYALLKLESPLEKSTSNEHIVRIDRLLQEYSPTSITLRGDYDDYLLNQIDVWQNEFFALKDHYTKLTAQNESLQNLYEEQLKYIETLQRQQNNMMGNIEAQTKSTKSTYKFTLGRYSVSIKKLKKKK